MAVSSNSLGRCYTTRQPVPHVSRTRCSASAVHRRCGTPVGSLLETGVPGLHCITSCCSAPGTRDCALPVQPSAGEAEQALGQEDDDGDEDDTERDQIGKLVAEQPAEEFAEQEEGGGAEERADQRA